MEPLFQTLSFEELSNLCATNLEYREICENDRIWETLYLRDYGQIFDHPVVSWKFEYLLARSQPKMVIFDREFGLIQAKLPFLPGAYIQKVDYRIPELVILDRSGLLYWANLEEFGDSDEFEGGILPFQLAGDYKFLDIVTSSNLAISEDQKLVRYFLDEDSLIVEEVPELINEKVVQVVPGFYEDEYIITSRKDLLIKRSWRIYKVDSGVDKVYPLAQYFFILTKGDKAYLFDDKDKINPLVIDGSEVPAMMIREVHLNTILLQNGKLYRMENLEFINLTEQWSHFDPKWSHNIIKSVSESTLLLDDGSIWDISKTTILSSYNFKRRIMSLSTSEKDKIKRGYLPQAVNLPERIISMSGQGLLGEKGNLYIKRYSGYEVENIDAGFRPNRFEEVTNENCYVLWRNYELTISRDLYQLLVENQVVENQVVENQVVENQPGASSFWYQQRLIRIVD